MYKENVQESSGKVMLEKTEKSRLFHMARQIAY